MKTKRATVNQIRIVRSAKKLSILLGTPFVLFIGSAVSGCNFPRLPMVLSFIKKILEVSAEILRSGSYGDRLLAKYALSFCNGKHSSLLETTKFEEFL